MTFDDLQRAWNRRGASGGGTDPAQELEAVRARARELGDAVRRRDRRETLVALALVPIFGYFALQAEGFVVRLGSVILVAACLLIPLRLRAARRGQPDPGLPVAAFLRLELEFVVRQRRLLLSVPLWYLGPLGLGAILFFAGSGVPRWVAVVYAAAVVLFFHWLYRLNRTAVTGVLEPKERELRLWIELAGESGEKRKETDE